MTAVHVKLRHRTYFAFMEIPRPLRSAFGKARFKQTLKTSDRREAERRADVLKLQWQREIDSARKSTPDDPLERDARWWRDCLRSCKDDVEREIVLDLISDHASRISQDGLLRAGVQDESELTAEDVPELGIAKRFYSIATAKLIPFDEHVEEFLTTRSRTNTAKYIDESRRTLLAAGQRWPMLDDVTRKVVQVWIDEQRQRGLSTPSVKKVLSSLRTYWKWLEARQLVKDERSPFEKLIIPEDRQKLEAKRQGFTATEVVNLVDAAIGKDDQHLTDLIRLAMFTGGRKEALCCIRVEDVDLEHGSLKFVDDKTAAGRRTIPLHSTLRPTIERLISNSSTGYLIEGQKANKYDDRSGALGQRFRRLRTELGFGREKVFHSIRHTVTTMLQDAGVPDVSKAAILGHEPVSFTDRTYGSGAGLETLRGHLEQAVRYPGYKPA